MQNWTNIYLVVLSYLYKERVTDKKYHDNAYSAGVLSTVAYRLHYLKIHSNKHQSTIKVP